MFFFQRCKTIYGSSNNTHTTHNTQHTTHTHTRTHAHTHTHTHTHTQNSLENENTQHQTFLATAVKPTWKPQQQMCSYKYESPFKYKFCSEICIFLWSYLLYFPFWYLSLLPWAAKGNEKCMWRVSLQQPGPLPFFTVGWQGFSTDLDITAASPAPLGWRTRRFLLKPCMCL